MDSQSTIKQIVNQILQGDDLFVVQVTVSGAENSMKVSVEIDGDNGISIDQCAKLSRELGTELEEIELFSLPYRLEVSSPGIDKPLRLKRQYDKNIGRDVKVILTDGTELSGKLQSTTTDEISVAPFLSTSKKGAAQKYEVIERNVPFNLINKTNIIISFK